MFSFLKRLQPEPTVDELRAIRDAAQREVEEKWLYFCKTLHFNTDVPLANRIQAFASPVREFISNKYPTLLQGPGQLFWLIIFNAVLASGTHSAEEVNAAVAELRKQFVKP